MTINFTCPHCNQSSVVGDEFAGQSGPCRFCGKVVTVPMRNVAAGGGSWGATAAILAVLGIGGVLCAGVLVALLLPAVQAARTEAQHIQSTNHLKQIGLAFHNYHDVYGSFPPAYHVDEEGRRTLSWRMAILPFIEQQNIFDMYNANEPWDSVVNQRVANVVIPTYKNPADSTGAPNETSYMVITGPGTLFEEGVGVKFQDLIDGASNTIMAVEVVGTGVKWSEPKDLDINTMIFKINAGGANAIGSPFPGGANVLMADGSVRFLSNDTLEQTLRAMVTRAGGEIIPAP